MNNRDAMQALLDGKRIRNVDWAKNKYIFFCNATLSILDEDNGPDVFTPTHRPWEIFEVSKMREHWMNDEIRRLNERLDVLETFFRERDKDLKEMTDRIVKSEGILSIL